MGSVRGLSGHPYHQFSARTLQWVTLVTWYLHKFPCLCGFGSLGLLWEINRSATTSTAVSRLNVAADLSCLLPNTGSPSSAQQDWGGWWLYLTSLRCFFGTGAMSDFLAAKGDIFFWVSQSFLEKLRPSHTAIIDSIKILETWLLCLVQVVIWGRYLK